MTAVEAVVFDLGGVLLRNGGPHDLAAQFPGADPARVVELIMGPHHLDTDHPWHRLERGEITMAELREGSRERFAAAGVGVPARPAPEIVFEARTEMIELVVELRAAGLRTGMLTNNVAELRGRWWPVAQWTELFDDIVDSHEVGMRKPNPAIYRLALDRLAVSASRTVFLDDLAPNVEAARGVGMTGVLVDPADASPAIAEVRRLVGLPVA